MSLKNALLAIVCLIAAFNAESAENSQAVVEWGELSLSGSACTQSANGAIREVQAGIYDVPVTLALNKALDKSLGRGTCMLALPVQVAAGYRLVLSDLSARASLNLRKGNRSRLDLEVFKAGLAGKVLTAQNDASKRRLLGSFGLSQVGDVVALDCGESGLLRANVSAVLQGSPRALISLDRVRIKARVEKCQN